MKPFKSLLSILWLFPLVISGLLLITFFVTPTSVGAALGVGYGRALFIASVGPLVWLSSVLLLAHLKVSKGRRYQQVKLATLILTSLVLIEAGFGYNSYLKERAKRAPDGTATSVVDAERVFNGLRVTYTPEAYKATSSRVKGSASIVTTYNGPTYKKPATSNPRLIQTYQDSYELGQYRILPGMENLPCTLAAIPSEIAAQLDTCVQDGDYHYYQAETGSAGKTYRYDTQGYRVSLRLYGEHPLDRGEIDKIIKGVR